jgi:hypothetical protein
MAKEPSPTTRYVPFRDGPSKIRVLRDISPDAGIEGRDNLPILVRTPEVAGRKIVYCHRRIMEGPSKRTIFLSDLFSPEFVTAIRASILSPGLIL